MFYHNVPVTENQNCIYYALATQRCRRKLYVFGLFVRHVRSFVRTDLVTAISHKRLEQF